MAGGVVVPASARLVVREEAPVLDDGGADRVEPLGELVDRDRLAREDARQEARSVLVRRPMFCAFCR